MRTRQTPNPDSSLRRATQVRRHEMLMFDAVAPYLIIAVLLIAWELTTYFGLVLAFLLPPPLAVARWVADDIWSGRFFINAIWTLYRALAGFALSSALGVAIGILMSRSKSVFWFFDPIVSIGLPIPKIALFPVFMLWFGLHDESKILMVAFSACFQVIASTWQATQSVERELIWHARSVGASERAILWEVVMRAASPQIITGLQITFPVCLIVVLITEMQTGGQGLGDAMLSAARYAKTTGVLAAVVEIGFVGSCAITIMERLRRRLLVWHQESRREQIES